MEMNATDYSGEAVEAARSVLLELAHLLTGYRDEAVLVGGWVPELLLPNSPVPHVGSLDVDIALDHRALQEPRYQPLKQALLERGYVLSTEQPFIFYRDVETKGRVIRVQVDFLAGEYDGTGPKHRTQNVEDLKARKARGCDLALELNTDVRLVGILPDGAHDTAVIRIASVVPFLVMKGIALAARMKTKDAWDTYYVLLYYPGGPEALAAEFAPHLQHGLVREGLRRLAEKFASPDSIGPRWAADFQEPMDVDEHERIKRDAYERMQALLARLGG